jgi:hypothetical protein
MYTNNRDAYRQTFFAVWQKYRKKLPLEPLEKQLIEVMLLHPEYHPYLDKPKAFEAQEFSIEENPFFHMSLHLAVRDQLRMGKPDGVKDIYRQLVEKYGNDIEAEHKMMACIANMIWTSQKTGEVASEEDYLATLRLLLVG